MKLIPLPAFSDNYIWLLHHNGRALVVDPGEAAPVRLALQQMGLQLESILVTHHHGDHIGGVTELVQATGAQVYGPCHERLAGPVLDQSVTALGQGDVASALGLNFQVLDVPGHTAGHIAYFAPSVPLASGQAPVLFCGDTLFSGGCGRLFEGTPAQMLASMDALAALPGDTHVCCAHEYTLSNLRFACAVDPTNSKLSAYMTHCHALREQGLPTLPANLGLETQINPFLRTREPALIQAARSFQPNLPGDAGLAVAVFAAIREWKNQFK